MFKKGLYLIVSTMILVGCGNTDTESETTSKTNTDSGNYTEIVLDDYLTFEANKYNGYGHLSARFDDDQLIEDYSPQLEELDTWPVGMNNEEIIEHVLDEYVDKRFENKKNASNGEIREYHITVEREKYLKDVLGIVINTDPIEYTVSGLEDVVEIDPFENIKVVRRNKPHNPGISEYPYLYVDHSTSEYGNHIGYTFQTDNDDPAVGETITLIITDTSKNSMGENHGLVPTVTEKDFVIQPEE